MPGVLMKDTRQLSGSISRPSQCFAKRALRGGLAEESAECSASGADRIPSEITTENSHEQIIWLER
jgi:hypothetical protein